MSNLSDAPSIEELTAVTATEAKNTFGAVLDRLAADGRIAITKHDEVRAVLLSTREYEALVSAQPDPLAELAGEFETLVGRMQTPEADRAGRALFDASPTKLGQAAVKPRRRRGR